MIPVGFTSPTLILPAVTTAGTAAESSNIELGQEQGSLENDTEMKTEVAVGPEPKVNEGNSALDQQESAQVEV